MKDLFLAPFRGFAYQDFAAYAPEKWASNLHTRARTEVRDKLNALGRLLAPHLLARAPDLAWSTNDPAPNVFNGRKVDAQRLTFTRGEEQQRQLSTLIDKEKSIADNLKDAAHEKRHLMLGVAVEHGGLTAELALHRNASVDLRNAAQKLLDPWEHKRLGLLLTALAEAHPDLTFRAPAGDLPLPDLQPEHVTAALDALASGQGERVAFALHLPADDPRVQSEHLAQHLTALLLDLLPLYLHLRWARDNDFMALRAELEKKRDLSRREGVTLEPGDAVHITSGLFAGKDGVVQELDKKGMARVAIGKLVVQVKGTALKRLA